MENRANNKKESELYRILKYAAVFIFIMSIWSYTFSRHSEKVLDEKIENLGVLSGIKKESSDDENTVTENAVILQGAETKILELNRIKELTDMHPYPLLIKELKDSCRCFVPIYFNKAFSDLFLLPNNINPSTYLYSKEHSNWPDSLASEYQREDFRVLYNGKEEFNVDFTHNKKIKKGKFVKWSNGRDVVYLCYSGIIIK